MKPFISQILANYNGEKYLKRCIEAFLSQEYDAKELIIIDGKSTDRSHKIIADYEAKYENIKWLKINDRGISDAINHGIDASRGDLIGYMGNDDIFYSSKVYNTIEYNYRWCDFDAIYFNAYGYNEEVRKCKLYKPRTQDFSRESLLKNSTIVGGQDIWFNKRVYEQYRYDVNNKYSMDYDLYLRMSYENHLFLYVDEVAFIHNVGDNISFKLQKEQFNEACKVAAKHIKDYKGRVYHSKTNEKELGLKKMSWKGRIKSMIIRILNKIIRIMK